MYSVSYIYIVTWEYRGFKGDYDNSKLTTLLADPDFHRECS